MQVFCCRLKFSRYAQVVLVDNQRTEMLVRSMADDLEWMRGIPLLVVFDSVLGHRIEDGVIGLL